MKKSRASGSSRQQSSSGNTDLLSFIPDIMVMLMELILDIFILFFKVIFKKISHREKINKNYLRLDQLKVSKVSTKKEELGFCINLKKPFLLNQLDMSKHTFIVGPPGWGKTNLINLLMENDLQRNRPIFFIDPKGTLEEIVMFKNLSRYYQRKLYIFSEHYPEHHTFNPLKNIDPSSAAGILMRAFTWSNEYYRDCCESALIDTIHKLIETKQIVSIPNIYHYIVQNYQSIDEVQGIITKLKRIILSQFGKLFEDRGQAKTISEIRQERACIYVGLSTMGYGETAKAIGKLFLSELMWHSYKISTEYADSHIPIKESISVYIDEAGAILNDDYIDLLSKCRGSGVQLCTAQQTLADLDAISPTLARRCFEESSNIFIQKQASDQEGNYLSKSIGTFLSEKKTIQTLDGDEGDRGTVRETYEYLVHPNLLKEIRVGQAILVQHNPKRIYLLNIRSARESEAFALKRKNVGPNRLEAKVSSQINRGSKLEQNSSTSFIVNRKRSQPRPGDRK